MPSAFLQIDQSISQQQISSKLKYTLNEATWYSKHLNIFTSWEHFFGEGRTRYCYIPNLTSGKLQRNLNLREVPIFSRVRGECLRRLCVKIHLVELKTTPLASETHDVQPWDTGRKLQQCFLHLFSSKQVTTLRRTRSLENAVPSSCQLTTCACQLFSLKQHTILVAFLPELFEYFGFQQLGF